MFSNLTTYSLHSLTATHSAYRDTLSDHPMYDLLTEEQVKEMIKNKRTFSRHETKIIKAALQAEHDCSLTPFGLFVLKTVYNMLSVDELSGYGVNWSTKIKIEKLFRLNKALKTWGKDNQAFRLKLEEVTIPVSQCLYSIALFNLFKLIAKCPPEYRNAILTRSSINQTDDVISHCLAANPNTPSNYLLQIFSLFNVSFEPVECIHKIRFNKYLGICPDVHKTPITIDDQDKLFVLLICLLRHSISEDEIFSCLERINDFLTTSRGLSALKKISRQLKNFDMELGREEELSLNLLEERAQELVIFLKRFYQFCCFTGSSASFVDLIEDLMTEAQTASDANSAVSESSENEDVEPSRTFVRQLWIASKEAIYGFNYCLVDMALYRQVREILNRYTPQDISHAKTIEHMLQVGLNIDLEGLSGEQRLFVDDIGKLLYKTWWFIAYIHSDSEKLKQRHTIADRLVDWLAFDKDLAYTSADEFVKIIGASLKTDYPCLPFNSCRAWSVYYKLNSARTRRNLEAQLTEEERKQRDHETKVNQELAKRIQARDAQVSIVPEKYKADIRALYKEIKDYNNALAELEEQLKNTGDEDEVKAIFNESAELKKTVADLTEKLAELQAKAAKKLAFIQAEIIWAEEGNNSEQG